MELISASDAVMNKVPTQDQASVCVFFCQLRNLWTRSILLTRPEKQSTSTSLESLVVITKMC
jgi:hypothetical protein